MLILSRKVGEEIKIGDGLTVRVTRISGNRVSVGIAAPREAKILRGELQRRQVIEKKCGTDLHADDAAL